MTESYTNKYDEVADLYICDNDKILQEFEKKLTPIKSEKIIFISTPYLKEMSWVESEYKKIVRITK